MEAKNCNRREFFKRLAGLAVLTLTGCAEKPPEDKVIHLNVCNVGIDINLSQGKVVYKNLNAQPIYVEIRDEADHLLGYNVLFSVNEEDFDPINVNYGQTIFISTWKIEPATLEYEFCEKKEVTLPREEELAREDGDKQKLKVGATQGRTARLIRDWFLGTSNG